MSTGLLPGATRTAPRGRGQPAGRDGVPRRTGGRRGRRPIAGRAGRRCVTGADAWRRTWQAYRLDGRAPRVLAADRRATDAHPSAAPASTASPYARRVEAAFFDLDKTVIAKASMVAFGRPLLQAGHDLAAGCSCGRCGAARLPATSAPTRSACARSASRRCASPRAGTRPASARIVRETLDEVIEPIVYDEALELIREHQAAGRRVFIVSASPEEIVAPLAQYLGVDEAIASRAELDDDGRYTGEVEFYVLRSVQGRRHREASPSATTSTSPRRYAYSDSATDLPMLEAVGHPVRSTPTASSPASPHERDWEVRHFTRRVPLRDRVPMPRPRRLVLAGAGCAVAALGGVGWWWWRRATASPTRRRDKAVDALRGATQRSASQLAATQLSATRRVAALRSATRRPADTGRHPDLAAAPAARPQAASCSFFTANAARASTTMMTMTFFMAGSVGRRARVCRRRRRSGRPTPTSLADRSGPGVSWVSASRSRSGPPRRPGTRTDP